MSEMKVANATFYCFKGYSLGRKYYTEGRGTVGSEVWGPTGNYLDKILALNGGNWPGLGGRGDDFFRVVIPDEDVDYGWPLMFDPARNLKIDPATQKED